MRRSCRLQVELAPKNSKARSAYRLVPGEPVEPVMVSPTELSSMAVKYAGLHGKVRQSMLPLNWIRAVVEFVRLLNFTQVPPSIIVVPLKATRFVIKYVVSPRSRTPLAVAKVL